LQPRKKSAKGESACEIDPATFGAGFLFFAPIPPDAGGYMSVWQTIPASNPSLRGADGELISISIPVEPSGLEDLLETLAGLSFPVNPEIDHAAAPGTLVEFPAYVGDLDEVIRTLRKAGFDTAHVKVRDMLEEIHARYVGAH
jgi:hypothetical protein